MAGIPALRPTAKRFSPILLRNNLALNPTDASFSSIQHRIVGTPRSDVESSCNSLLDR